MALAKAPKPSTADQTVSTTLASHGPHLSQSRAVTMRLRDHPAGSLVFIPPQGEAKAYAPALRFDAPDPAFVLLGSDPWTGAHRPGWQVVASPKIPIAVLNVQCPGVHASMRLEPIETVEPDLAAPWEAAMAYLALGEFGARVVAHRPDAPLPALPIDPTTWTIDSTAHDLRPTAVAVVWRLVVDLASGPVEVVVRARSPAVGPATGGIGAAWRRVPK